MALLLSKSASFRESLPSFFFEAKKPVWPNPESSLGDEYRSIGRPKCWQAIGPALELKNTLLVPIHELLNNHRDSLEQGESKTTAISFSVYMLGYTPQSAYPAVVFTSRSRRQRKFAQALLKESKLLDCHPSVHIKTLEAVPMIPYAGEHIPGTFEDVSPNGVYMVDDSRGYNGSLIAFGGSRLATMGGVLLINGNHYGISVQHARLDGMQENEEVNLQCGPLRFDDDSDTEESDLVEITSGGSISSDSDYGSTSESFVTSTEDSENLFENSYAMPLPRRSASGCTA